MRVVLNVEQLLQRPPGGIGRYTAELARRLPGRADDSDLDIDLVPFVAWHRRVSVDAALRAAGLRQLDVRRLPLPRPVLYDAWHVLGAPPLGAFGRDLGGGALVHAPSLAVPPRGAGRLVVTVHDAAAVLHPETLPPRGRRFHRAGIRAAARRADAVIAPTRAAAEEIAEHTPIPLARIRVVPHGVTPRVVPPSVVAALRARHGLGSTPYVVWVGTLEPRKNVAVLLEAFAAVVRAGLPHRLVLVGPRGWLDTADAVRRAAEPLGDRVRWLGPATEGDLAALYRGADLFAFPSRHEGFGLPVLEAMTQSTAVLAADIPSLREVGGAAARFVPPTEVEAWAAALVDLLRDDAARAELAAAGRAHAAGFTWDRCVAQTRAVYREVAS